LLDYFEEVEFIVAIVSFISRSVTAIVVVVLLEPETTNMGDSCK
jgi:hypothetical protein